MSEINSKNLETLTITDFNQICRFCASKNNLIQLYDNTELINKIKLCTNLEFDENDALPNKVCENCVSKVAELHKFINNCKTTNEKYKKCLLESTNTQIKVENIAEFDIKEEYHEEETPIPYKKQLDQHENREENALQEFVRLGMSNGCNAIILRHFIEKQGAEKLSLHILLTSFVSTNQEKNYENFLKFCSTQMSDDLCEIIANEKKSELALEMRYGRITSSKIHSVSCCHTPDEYYIEGTIAFYKTNDYTIKLKTNEASVFKEIERQLNIRIIKRTLLLNKNYPEFIAKIDGVTEDAVIKLKYPKYANDIAKYCNKHENLTAKIKTEMHLCMLMANVKCSFLCIVDPKSTNNNTIIKVDYNERFFAEILRKSREFWKIHIFPTLLEIVT